MEEITCKRCQKTMPIGHFTLAGERRSICANCERYQRYGLTKQQIQHMLDAQENQCALCTIRFIVPRDFVIDHDHSRSLDDRKFVRGLLCPTCNKALGMFQDKPQLLRRAIAYLERADRMFNRIQGKEE